MVRRSTRKPPNASMRELIYDSPHAAPPPRPAKRIRTASTDSRPFGREDAASVLTAIGATEEMSTSEGNAIAPVVPSEVADAPASTPPIVSPTAPVGNVGESPSSASPVSSHEPSEPSEPAPTAPIVPNGVGTPTSGTSADSPTGSIQEVPPLPEIATAQEEDTSSQASVIPPTQVSADQDPDRSTAPLDVSGFPLLGVSVYRGSVITEVRVPESRQTRSTMRAFMDNAQAVRRRLQAQIDADAAVAAALDAENEEELGGALSPSVEDEDPDFGNDIQSASPSQSLSSSETEDDDFESAPPKKKRRVASRSPSTPARAPGATNGATRVQGKRRRGRRRRSSTEQTSPNEPGAEGNAEKTSSGDRGTFGVLQQRHVSADSAEDESDATEVDPEVAAATSMLYENRLGIIAVSRESKGEFAIGLQEMFDSWEHFHEAVATFFSARYQLFKKRTSTSVKTRNKKILEAEVGELIPLVWKTYAMTYKCTHGLKTQLNKKTTAAAAVRARKHVRATGCTATINAVVEQVRGGPKGWKVTWNATGGHNHNVSAELFRYYCENRLPKTRELVADVRRMMECGSSSTGVLLKLREETGNPIMRRDVQNLIAHIKQKNVAGTSVEERLQVTLTKFVDHEDGNWARIYKDPRTKFAHSVVWQSARMRRWFRAYPEVVMVDCTHSTNRSKFLLFSFVIHDVFGKGQYAMHSLIHRETMDNMEDAVNAFVNHNEAYTKIRAFIVDKDFRERKILRKYFPNARILLCYYHVIKVFAKKVKALVRGTTGEKDEIIAVMRALVYAKSRAAYDALKLLLAKVLQTTMGEVDDEDYDEDRDGDGNFTDATEDEGGDDEVDPNLFRDDEELDRVSELALRETTDDPNAARGRRHRFYKYLTANWDSCIDEWVLFMRQNVAYLGNNTNNRIEAKQGATKRLVHGSMDLEQTVRAIQNLQGVSEDEYMEALTRTGVKMSHTEDLELNQLLNLVSEHAYSLVETEYKKVASKAIRYTIRVEGNNSVLKSASTPDGDDHAEHTVAVETFQCSCFFAQIRLLPCRHVMFIRQYRGYETIIPFTYINPRWVLRHPTNNILEGDVAPGSLRVVAATQTRFQKLRQPDKFSFAMGQVLRPIANIMALQDAATFEKTINLLQNLKDSIEKGTVPTLRGAGSSDPAATEPDTEQEDEGRPSSGSARPPPNGPRADSSTLNASELPSPPSSAPESTPPNHPQPSTDPQTTSPNPPEFLLPGVVSMRNARSQQQAAERQQLYEKIKNAATRLMASQRQEPRVCSLADLQAVITQKGYSYRTLSPLICGLPFLDATTTVAVLVRKRPEHVIADSSAVRYILPESCIVALTEEMKEVDKRGGVEYVITVGNEEGCISSGQLQLMEKFVTILEEFYKVTVATEWIKRQKLDGAPFPEPFDTVSTHANQNLVNETVEACELLPLTDVVTPVDRMSGVRALRFLSSEWLASEHVLAILGFIHNSYIDVGIIKCDFTGVTGNHRRDVLQYGDPLNPSNTRIVSIVNIGGAHWQAFYICRQTRKIHLCDPLRIGRVRGFKKLAKMIKEDIQPLLEGEYEYVADISIVQPDGHSCAVMCGMFLETMLSDKPWDPAVVPSAAAYRARYMTIVSAMAQSMSPAPL